jgi:hypothetical protein
MINAVAQRHVRDQDRRARGPRDGARDDAPAAVDDSRDAAKQQVAEDQDRPST